VNVADLGVLVWHLFTTISALALTSFNAVETQKSRKNFFAFTV